VSCSTPTHAAEAAVPVDRAGARRSPSRCPTARPRPRHRGARGHWPAPLARPPSTWPAGLASAAAGAARIGAAGRAGVPAAARRRPPWNRGPALRWTGATPSARWRAGTRWSGSGDAVGAGGPPCAGADPLP
jgi:hypothetical protein